MLLSDNRPSHPRTHQLVMSRKNAQPAGLSWKPSSLWNSDMRTSLSVVPMQLNFCMSSASTSMSVPSMGDGCPVVETGWCGEGGDLSQFSPRPCPAITTSSTTTSVSAHGRGTLQQSARHLHQSRSGRLRHLLLFAAAFSLVYQWIVAAHAFTSVRSISDDSYRRKSGHCIQNYAQRSYH